MLTPKLEELILCGKAFFKTFVAGGEKHTLNISNDRFIIITDITYFPINIIDRNARESFNTQLAIYGERGYNNFIFRNFIRKTEQDYFLNPVTLNLYLLHEQQVGFSFCNAHDFSNLNIGVANVDNPAYQPPIEFGKDGQTGAIPTVLTMDTNTVTPIQTNLTTRPLPGINESQQLLFPFSDDTAYRGQIDKNPSYPLLLVNYVEVLGSANNIQI